MTKFTYIPQERCLRGHRANGQMVNNYPLQWINPGEPPVLEGYGSFNREVISSVSVNTPLWDVPKPRYIQVPSTFRPLKKPVPPTLHAFKGPKRPTRRIGSSDAQWQRILRKYDSLKARKFERYRAYLVSYQLRLDRYNAKLKSYEEKAKRRDFIYFLTVAKLAGSVVNPVNNPHSRTKIIDSGWNIDFTYRETYYPIVDHGQKYTYLSPGPGDIVNREYRLFGVSDYNPGPGWPYDHPFPELISYSPAGSLINTADWIATNLLHKRIGDQSVHVGNILAERAQTYSMFVSSYMRLKNFLHSPKRSVLEYLSSGRTKRIANDFLQYCFGVEPLVKDVYAAVNALAESGNSAPDFIKVKSRGVSSDGFSQTNTTGFYTDVSTVTVEVTVRYMVEYTVSNATLNSLRNYGLINPAEIAWEVMPWSFVIDWFLPISTYIQSLTGDSGLEFKTGTRSVMIKTTKTTNRTYHRNAYLYNDLGKDYTGSIVRTQSIETYDRTLLTGPPAVRLPRFKNPFSFRHVALSLALWRQRR